MNNRHITKDSTVNTFLKTVLSLVVLSVLFSALLPAQEKEIAEGKTAMANGDMVRAIDRFREAVSKDKKRVESYVLLAEALYQADSLNALQPVIIIALDLEPRNSKLHVIQGNAWMKQKLTTPAIGEYMKAVEIDSQNLDVWVKLSEAQTKARQYNDASKSWQKVLGLDSNNVPALRALSSIYFRAKQYGNAGVFLEKLVRLQPDSLDYKIKYVKCLYETKRFKELIPVAEEVLSKDASQTDVSTWLAEAYQATGQIDSLIAKYDKMDAKTMKADDLARYARALQSVQRYEDAEAKYILLFNKDSSRCDLRYFFGTNEMKLKKWSEAVEQFEKKIDCDTSAGFKFASHLNAAMSLMQMKKFKDAIDHTKKAISYRPDNVQAYSVLAECYGQTDQISEESATYRKVIEMAGAADDPKYDPFLEEAYRMIGIRKLQEALKIKDPEKNRPLYEEAAKNIEKALQFNPRNCDGLYFAGVCFQNSNNKEKAKKYYNRFLESCPKDKRAEEVQNNIKSLGS